MKARITMNNRKKKDDKEYYQFHPIAWCRFKIVMSSRGYGISVFKRKKEKRK